MSFLISAEWVDTEQGSFVLAPANVTHDFENQTSARAGILNFSYPGQFGQHMPATIDWFKQHPSGGCDLEI